MCRNHRLLMKTGYSLVKLVLFVNKDRLLFGKACAVCSFSGGNAKTLMFVNISPADYNADETVISLT